MFNDGRFPLADDLKDLLILFKFNFNR